MADGEPILYSLYIYAPNKGAPIFFIAGYAISAIFYIWQCWCYHAVKLTGLHLICAVMFTVGYGLREYGASNYMYENDDMTPLIVFILSQVFVYVCPPLLELANYHILGRIFHYVPHLAPIPAGKVLGVFGGLMAAVELLNALGVALAANPSSGPSQQATGSYLTVAAISIQLVVIVIFVCIAGTFHVRCMKTRVPLKNIKTLLSTLYATSFMLINSALWNIWNPGRFLPKDYHIYLAQDGTEVHGERDTDKRPLLAKTANVLTFGLLFRRKRTNYAAQELAQYRDARQEESSGQGPSGQLTS
ncbi:RTA1 like protein [Hirsutella rhossiliensis]|uniref:RTA1 like protein n=1 Tax=Hirsutella rhossiliensis TaxID=111463 RepID=A0A9P8MSK9_9HYPO|nr:RTA1 like protein [Hirsutella rhossiliensis]KAH0959456.1 RTA1 like protein [Hirsutella rhossiliensis]